MLRRALSVFAVMLGTFWAAVVAPSAAMSQPSQAELVEDFLKVAFGDEFTGQDWEYLRRFEGPVRIRVIGDAPATDMKRLMESVSMAARYARHDIRIAQAHEKANIFVYFASPARYEELAERMAASEEPYNHTLRWQMARTLEWASKLPHSEVCLLRPEVRRDGPDLAYTHILINPLSTADHRYRCIPEELFQGLGLTADTKKRWPSIFSEARYPYDPSEYDLKYLEWLYSPVLRSGLTKSEVRQRLLGHAAADPSQGLLSSPGNGLLVESFLSLVLRSGKNGLRRGPYKWAGPVRVHLTERLTADESANLRAAIGALSKRAGIDIAIASSDEQHNVVIDGGVSLDIDDVLARRYAGSNIDTGERTRARQSLESALRFGSANYFLHAKNYVPSYFGQYIYRNPVYQVGNFCELNAIGNLFGVRASKSLPYPSVFSHWYDCQAELSPYDLLLLAIVAHPDIKAGMPENELAAAMRQLIERLRPDQSRPPEVFRSATSNLPKAEMQ